MFLGQSVVQMFMKFMSKLVSSYMILFYQLRLVKFAHYLLHIAF